MTTQSAASKTPKDAGIDAGQNVGQNVQQGAGMTVQDFVSGVGKKDLYEVGEIPPLGHVPKNMYAWAIRKDRQGEPDKAMQIEVVPTWQLDSHDVLAGDGGRRQLQRCVGLAWYAYFHV